MITRKLMKKVTQVLLARTLIDDNVQNNDKFPLGKAS